MPILCRVRPLTVSRRDGCPGAWLVAWVAVTVDVNDMNISASLDLLSWRPWAWPHSGNAGTGRGRLRYRGA